MPSLLHPSTSQESAAVEALANLIKKLHHIPVVLTVTSCFNCPIAGSPRRHNNIQHGLAIITKLA